MWPGAAGGAGSRPWECLVERGKEEEEGEREGGRPHDGPAFPCRARWVGMAGAAPVSMARQRCHVSRLACD